MAKRKNKALKSALAVIGVIAFAFLGFSTFAIIYTYVYENPYLYFISSLAIIILLLLIGQVTFKRIKNKLIDIFN